MLRVVRAPVAGQVRTAEPAHAGAHAPTRAAEGGAANRRCPAAACGLGSVPVHLRTWGSEPKFAAGGSCVPAERSVSGVRVSQHRGLHSPSPQTKPQRPQPHTGGARESVVAGGRDALEAPLTSARAGTRVTQGHPPRGPGSRAEHDTSRDELTRVTSGLFSLSSRNLLGRMACTSGRSQNATWACGDTQLLLPLRTTHAITS